MKILKSDLLRFTRLVFKMRRSQIFEREVNCGDESSKVLEHLVDLELMRMGRVDERYIKLGEEILKRGRHHPLTNKS